MVWGFFFSWKGKMVERGWRVEDREWTMDDA